MHRPQRKMAAQLSYFAREATECYCTAKLDPNRPNTFASEEVVIDDAMLSTAQSEAFHPAIVADRLWCRGKRGPDRPNSREHRRTRTQRAPDDHWRRSVVGRYLERASATTPIFGG